VEKIFVVSHSDLNSEVGKVVGGTKGNAVLEFINVSPSNEFEIKDPSELFDYDQLAKYGYSNLVTPVMKAGGRLAMYELMGLEIPEPKAPRKEPLPPSEIVMDSTGANDEGRYSGLKLGQVLDDATQGSVLKQTLEATKRGDTLRSRIVEEDYVQPFADKRNTGPQQTRYWTPESLDKWGKQQGKADSWARRAREKDVIKDPEEDLSLALPQRAYSLFVVAVVSLVFGKSTLTIAPEEDMQGMFGFVAALVGLSSLVSGPICALEARSKQRNSFTWLLKGFLGGPLTYVSLSLLPRLSRGHLDD